MSKKKSSPIICPCGSGLELNHCCGTYLDGALPPTAEALMRSRYSAYALGRQDYLQQTWHSSTRPSPSEQETDEPSLKWVSLTVHEHVPDGDTATVAFTARCKVSGRMTAMHEVSRFIFEDGRWWYVDGEVSC